MKLSLEALHPEKVQDACLCVGVFEDGKLTDSAKILNQKTHGYLSKAIKQSGFVAKLGQTLPLFHPAGADFDHILLVGLGASKHLTAPQYKRVIVAATKALAHHNNQNAVSYLTEVDVEKHDLAWKVKQIAIVTAEALYRFDWFKSTKEPLPVLSEITIALPNNQHKKACEKALEQGKAIAAGMLFTKNLANLPSNICTPEFIATQAKALGKSYKSVSVKVLDETEMQKLGMGAILAVAQGSAEEAQLICVEYKGAAKGKAPVALVGKGVTFDTGGISLKPGDAMVGMKYDMCGAATVLGTIKAAAELKLKINIVGVIPAVENMPGGTAYKPEDIITTMSGQTIEVLNTDAEGRVILADALTYCEKFKPAVVIDIATLTGAAVVALGTHISALLGNHEPLIQDLLHAGEQTNDRAWQMPMTDEYQEQIKSPFADMANTGGRMGGTITAACFLSRFTKNYHWAHLDVAGTAAMMMAGSERYATGRPVPLLMQYLIDKSSRA